MNGSLVCHLGKMYCGVVKSKKEKGRGYSFTVNDVLAEVWMEA